MRGPTRRACLFLPAADTLREVGWRPAVDVYRTQTGWLAKFELAGVRPEDVRCTVAGRRLTVAGVRRDWLLEEGCHYHALEISYSEFERRVDFPADLDRARVTTEYRAGMLLVRVELPEERP